MIAIGALKGIYMTHEVEYAVPLQYAAARGYRDLMARFNVKFSVHRDVCIDHDEITHLARP